MRILKKSRIIGGIILLYKSTRGRDENVASSAAIIKGMAKDGGLYVPESIPKINFDADEDELVKLNYKSLAYFILSKFFTDFTEEELKKCIDNAYDNKFDSDEIAPLKKIGGSYFLELYHGLTLAFKDAALSILPHLMKTALKKQGINKEVVILTATSGDTGKAALEGFNNVDSTKIIVLYPADGVSRIQKLQMVTHAGRNSCVAAVKGNFDDAQKAVKEIFADEDINRRLNSKGYMFSSANSINIGRLVPQIVYYFSSYLNLYKTHQIKKGDKVNAAVPTGNFGDILAGYFAKLMGLPINKLICASNENKVLYDFLNTGTYDANREFFVTNSPSMDILISSNLERLLYFISGENPETVRKLMADLKSSGKYSITSNMAEKLKDFYAGFASQEKTINSIKEIYNLYGEIIDTHTSVAYSVYKDYKNITGDKTKTIILSTASPFKFPKAVMSAIDKKYENVDEFDLIKELSKITNHIIPKGIKDIDERPIIHNTVCEKEKIKDFILEYLGI